MSCPAMEWHGLPNRILRGALVRCPVVTAFLKVLPALCSTACIGPAEELEAGPGPIDGGLAEIRTFEDYCATLQLVWQRRESECLGGTPEDFVQLTAICDAFRERLAAGRLAFDIARARDCIGAWRTMSCQQLQGRGATECIQVLVGTLGESQPCGAGDCSPGLSCQSAPGDEDGCPRICIVRRLREGEECDRRAPACMPGLFCDSRSGIPRCRARARIGEGCWDGTSCEDFPDAYCSSAGTCAKTHEEGVACRYSGECRSDLGCVGTATAAVCRVEKRIGEGCIPGLNECIGVLAYCNDDERVCLLRPRIGDACGVPAIEDSSCLLGFCSAESGLGICSAHHPVGARCTTDRECVWRQCEDGICVVPAGICE